MFYPDRDAGGAMFLPLPPAPSLSQKASSTAPAAAAAGVDNIPYDYYLLGVTPGLGRGVAALGIYNMSARTFSNTTGPPPQAGLAQHPAGGDADAEKSVGDGGCTPCGFRPDGEPVCCADLAAGYKKETYDAGDVKFGQ